MQKSQLSILKILNLKYFEFLIKLNYHIAMEQQALSSEPHVVIIPHPIQGHVTPMLHLAELLCHTKFNITLITSTYIHQRLVKSSDILGRFSRFPGFRFEAVDDGLPDEYPRVGKDGSWAVIPGFSSNVEPRLKELLSIGGSVACLIVDGWLSFAHDVAKEVGIPVIAFRCFGACFHHVSNFTPALVEEGHIPFKDEELDKLVKNLPGIDRIIRYRDLPSYCRTKDKATCEDLSRAFTQEIQKLDHVYGLILNTFEELEGPILSLLKSNSPRLYSIGPLHAHLKHRLTQDNNKTSSNHSSSLWEADQTCLSWLDQKPNKSVIYVGFGSLTIFDKEQVMAIWEGLVKCNKFFLWVIRPDLIIPRDNEPPTPVDVLQGTKERGCIVSWAPQEAVLAHRAVGGFFTHSGWNSTLESITAGVPMLCLPYFADQQVNSRYVEEAWKIGLDMKDTRDSNVVEKMVNDLMAGKKDELAKSTAKMSEAAKRSVSEGGSSYINLDSLIQDIKLMSLKKLS